MSEFFDENEGCRKHAYADKRAAVSALNYRLRGRKQVRHNRPSYLRAYCCDRCGRWHLTHGKAGNAK